MLLVYLGLLLLGGGVIAAQLVLGHDAPTGGDLDADAEATLPDATSEPGAGGLFLSLRFWSFACLAAGLTGTLCLLFGVLSGWPLALLSASLGLVSGASTSLALRALRRGSPPSTLSSERLVGQMARVLLPPRKGTRGKVRLVLSGQITDLMAVSDDEALSAGEEVLVLALRGAEVEVTRVEPPRLESRREQP